MELLAKAIFWTFFAISSSQNYVISHPLPTGTPVPSPNSQVQESSPAAQPLKVIHVHGSNYKFNPAVIKVKQGDHVKIIFTSDQESHDLVIPDYNVVTTMVGKGFSSELEFVADKKGSFLFDCAVDDHASWGMKGTLIVQ